MELAVGRTDLDRIMDGGCRDPECDHKQHKILYVHSICHKDAPGINVRYEIGSGVLSMSCSVCDRFIVKVKVAE